MGILINRLCLDGEISNFQFWMGKYLIREVVMGIYPNFSSNKKKIRF